MQFNREYIMLVKSTSVCQTSDINVTWDNFTVTVSMALYHKDKVNS